MVESSDKIGSKNSLVIIKSVLSKKLTSQNIIDDLNLLNDCFYERSKFGHFW